MFVAGLTHSQLVEGVSVFWAAVMLSLLYVPNFDFFPSPHFFTMLSFFGGFKTYVCGGRIFFPFLRYRSLFCQFDVFIFSNPFCLLRFFV